MLCGICAELLLTPIPSCWNEAACKGRFLLYIYIMQRSLTLQRISDNGLRTRGLIKIGLSTLYTIEEPWKDNQVGKSCVPPGTYNVVPHGWEPGTKLHQKRAYRLLNTEPRSGILIHSGNTVRDIEGCIIVGMKPGTLNGLDAVLQSVAAMDLLRGFMARDPFQLVIKGVVE